jgi:hypothetical protein
VVHPNAPLANTKAVRSWLTQRNLPEGRLTDLWAFRSDTGRGIHPEALMTLGGVDLVAEPDLSALATNVDDGSSFRAEVVGILREQWNNGSPAMVTKTWPALLRLSEQQGRPLPGDVVRDMAVMSKEMAADAELALELAERLPAEPRVWEPYAIETMRATEALATRDGYVLKRWGTAAAEGIAFLRAEMLLAMGLEDEADAALATAV